MQNLIIENQHLVSYHSARISDVNIVTHVSHAIGHMTINHAKMFNGKFLPTISSNVAYFQRLMDNPKSHSLKCFGN